MDVWGHAKYYYMTYNTCMSVYELFNFDLFVYLPVYTVLGMNDVR